MDTSEQDNILVSINQGKVKAERFAQQSIMALQLLVIPSGYQLNSIDHGLAD